VISAAESNGSFFTQEAPLALVSGMVDEMKGSNQPWSIRIEVRAPWSLSTRKLALILGWNGRELGSAADL
jgi:hypothetical protein